MTSVLSRLDIFMYNCSNIMNVTTDNEMLEQAVLVHEMFLFHMQRLSNRLN